MDYRKRKNGFRKQIDQIIIGRNKRPRLSDGQEDSANNNTITTKSRNNSDSTNNAAGTSNNNNNNIVINLINLIRNIEGICKFVINNQRSKKLTHN